MNSKVSNYLKHKKNKKMKKRSLSNNQIIYTNDMTIREVFFLT